MRVSEINLRPIGDSVELQAQVDTAMLPAPFRLWYRFPSSLQPRIDAGAGDFLVAALLLPAMKTGEPVNLPVPVSPALAHSLKWIQTIYRAWDPTLSVADVQTPLRRETAPEGTEVGLFFSSGVDSFYSLLKNGQDHPLNEDVIDSLIVIYGADIYLSDGKQTVFEQLLANARVIADHYGKRLLPVVTNVKELLSCYGIRRGFIGHGTTLFSVGLALEGVFRKIFISAGNTYNDLVPTGIHPLLDPLWSTESCRFMNDGLEAGRLEKTRLIARSELAMNTLRVCWAKESLAYNCGRCSKCFRTILALHVIGALDRCGTLPHTVDLETLRNLPLLTSYEEELFFEEIMDAMGGSETETAIKLALEEGLAKRRRYFARLAEAKRSIKRTIPTNEQFILVDQDGVRHEFGMGRRVIPFLENEGPPAEDQTAIEELERLRNAGARFMVFWWSDFWWLEHYKELNRHLRRKYPCVLENESLVVFDLREA